MQNSQLPSNAYSELANSEKLQEFSNVTAAPVTVPQQTVKDFQDWLDANHSTWLSGKSLNKGSGYGVMGNNTALAWKQYGEEYKAYVSAKANATASTGTSKKLDAKTGELLGGLAATVLAAVIMKPKNEDKQAIKLACGNKPLLVSSTNPKMIKYRKCVQDIMGTGTAPVDTGKSYETPPPPEKSNAVWWIVGISGFLVVAGLATFLIIRAKKKS